VSPVAFINPRSVNGGCRKDGLTAAKIEYFLIFFYLVDNFMICFMERSAFKVFSGFLMIVTGCLISGTLYGQVNAGMVKLSYNYPEKPVKYISKTTVNQVMDINGDKMEVNVEQVLGCTLRSTARNENDLTIEIKIDTVSRIINAPNGVQGGTIKEVMGKLFQMKIAPSGKVTDLSGAEQITFTDESGAITNASILFNDFFPKLSTVEMVAGHKWLSTDTTNTKSPAMSMTSIVKSDNTFMGLDKVGGINCARIVSNLSGTMEMISSDRNTGMDIKMKGPYEGSAELYFSVGDGYFIKHSTNITVTGTIEITASEVMSFPLIWESKSVNEIIE